MRAEMGVAQPQSGQLEAARAVRGPGPASTPALDLRPLELWQALEMGHDGRELHRPSDGSRDSDSPGSAPPSGLGDGPPSSLSPWGCGDVHCSQFTCVCCKHQHHDLKLRGSSPGRARDSVWILRNTSQ